MDVAGIKPYPVFDALKGTGTKGKFTFPTRRAAAQTKDIGVAHQWTVPEDMTLVATAGHLHPGGLYTDLNADARRARPSSCSAPRPSTTSRRAPCRGTSR